MYRWGTRADRRDQIEHLIEMSTPAQRGAAHPALRRRPAAGLLVPDQHLRLPGDEPSVVFTETDTAIQEVSRRAEVTVVQPILRAVLATRPWSPPTRAAYLRAPRATTGVIHDDLSRAEWRKATPEPAQRRLRGDRRQPARMSSPSGTARARRRRPRGGPGRVRRGSSRTPRPAATTSARPRAEHPATAQGRIPRAATRGILLMQACLEARRPCLAAAAARLYCAARRAGTLQATCVALPDSHSTITIRNVTICADLSGQNKVKTT